MNDGSPQDVTGLDNSSYSTSQAGKAKKGPVSCAECRRLKIRCDLSKLKIGPCTSCEKRGCGELCPDNSLKTGKGTRYILSGTEELHKQIEELRTRTKELEEALAISHSSHSTSVHELLKPEALKSGARIPSQAEVDESRLHTEFDALMISPSGKMQWLGSTALSEWFVKPEPSKNPRPQFDDPPGAPKPLNTDNLIFAADTLSQSQVDEYRRIILSSLPDRDTFDRLTNIYYEQVAWFYNPVPRYRLNEIAAPLYLGMHDRVDAHELSCVLTILALGSMMDISQPPDNPNVYRYSNFGKLCLSLDCIFGQTSVPTIEANLLRLIFLLFDRDRTAPMKVFGQLGLIWRLIISMGMHRDPARWNFSPEECIRRRRVFWEFVCFDTWQCLSWGRPSSVDPKSFDCRVPWENVTELEGEEPRFQRWKFIYVRDILLDVLGHSTRCGVSPTMGTVMRLDRKIRAYELFDMHVVPFADSTQPYQAIVYQRNIMFCIKESTLHLLHRPFFVSALNENLQDPLRSKFAGSVLAVHASASAILGRAKTLLDFQPHTPRFFIWWTQAFSAIVALGALVVRAPGSTLAASALTEINISTEAFRKAVDGFRPKKLLPSVVKLQERAAAAVENYRAGRPMSTEDSMDFLPGILSGSTLVPNALFPTASAHCALTGTFSIISPDPSPPAQQPEGSVETAVDEYLQSLQAELEIMAQQHPSAQWGSNGDFMDTTGGYAQTNALDYALLGQQYLPPTAPLLSHAPPFMGEAQMTPSYDPALWTGFMAALG